MKIYMTPPSRAKKIHLVTLNESQLNDEALYGLNRVIVEYLEDINKESGWSIKSEEE